LKKILLLSDTHSYIDERILHYAGQADEIWHAGDFGNLEVFEALESKKPLRAVYGNIDGSEIRSRCSEVLSFNCEGLDVLMVHIGGYPGRYTPLAKEALNSSKPNLFISGHSHILKVLHDKKLALLHLNPGACGRQGWHQKRTMLSFEIEKGEIKNLVVIELGNKTEKSNEN